MVVVVVVGGGGSDMGLDRERISLGFHIIMSTCH